MLPVIVKTEEANKLLAKRSREPEQGEDSGAPEKRKRIGNGQGYATFKKNEAASQAAEEMLNKYLVQPSVKYSDLGGLDNVIKELREMIEWPLKHSKIFQFLGVKPPKGILISGPPGTGKTQLAMAIAGENPEIPFYKLNAPEFVSGLSG